jgi:hypothetical protein
MATIKYRSSNAGFNRPAAEAVKRPDPIDLPKAIEEAVTADEAEMFDFGVAGAYVNVVHGKLFGVPLQGELFRNGPDTPRVKTADAEKWLRSMGLLELKSKAITRTSQHGENYAQRFFVKAE